MKKKYYKGFDQNLCCRDFQYEIGKTYKIDESPILCEYGFHFCDSIENVYKFYDMSDDTRVCEVEPLGEIIKAKNGLKYVTNEIKIIKEIKNPRKLSNVNKNSRGYCNSGYNNSGNCNSGDYNIGHRNSGDYNSGHCNSGHNNSGDYNSGHWNSGYWNSGNYNSGSWNSGNYNSGNCNSGDWNSGSGNSGIFNTDEEAKIKIFNKPSNWTYNDWCNSKAYSIMINCPYAHSEFISENNMTDKEKREHPEYTVCSGYVKIFYATDEDRQKWWDIELDSIEKEAVLSLPNFDPKIFKKCTGIDV